MIIRLEVRTPKLEGRCGSQWHFSFMLTCHVALKYLGHPPRKLKQREPLLQSQVEHLHQQMFLQEVERQTIQWCVRVV